VAVPDVALVVSIGVAARFPVTVVESVLLAALAVLCGELLSDFVERARRITSGGEEKGPHTAVS